MPENISGVQRKSGQKWVGKSVGGWEKF